LGEVAGDAKVDPRKTGAPIQGGILDLLDYVRKWAHTMGMNIVFLGSGAFGIPSLEALVRAGHRLSGVITQPDRPAGRGKHEMPTPVAQWAANHGLPIVKTADANGPDVTAKLKEWAPECFVVIAFGQKLSDELLAMAPHRGINLHASLLPKYRGAAPINWAVINNDALAGVSVIEVARVMDAGAILGAAETPIGRAETAGELHDRLADLGAPVLAGVVARLAGGGVERIIQEEAKATRARKLSRELAWVDFAQSAEIASARIRGLSPWPGVQVEVLDAAGKSRGPATILKCQASPSQAAHGSEDCGRVLADRTVACGTGSLEIQLIQPAGKKAMELQAFANGYGFGPGARLRSVVRNPG
jgi:methionyl-tRNA formyltransferase